SPPPGASRRFSGKTPVPSPPTRSDPRPPSASPNSRFARVPPTGSSRPDPKHSPTSSAPNRARSSPSCSSAKPARAIPRDSSTPSPRSSIPSPRPRPSRFKPPLDGPNPLHRMLTPALPLPMSRVFPIPLAALSALILSGLPGFAADEAAALRFFEMEVRPLLAKECYQCHGPEKMKGGLRLDHLDFIVKGGDTGPALVAGKPQDSLLIEAVRRGDPDFTMPPKKALSDAQVAALEKWIALGAPWPTEVAKEGATDENGFTEED